MWKSVVAMVHHQNLILDGVRNSDVHVVARSGARIRVIRPVTKSFNSKLFACSLFAQQLITAAAVSGREGFDNSSFWGRLNLIGFVSVFKTTAAKTSLSYSALNNACWYLTGHIGPGSLDVAAVLFQVTEFSWARLFAFGEAEDACTLVQLGSADGLRYIGLKSDTDCPVANAVGASIVREHKSLWENEINPEAAEHTQENGTVQQTQEHGSQELFLTPQTHSTLEMEGNREMQPVGRDAGRKVEVIVLEAKKEGETEDIHVSLMDDKALATFLGGMPFVVTLILVIVCFRHKEWIVGGLILGGCLAMTIAVLGLRLGFVFKYSTAKPATGVPVGDCLVIDDKNPNVLHVIEGAEKNIQALFQRRIEYEANQGKVVLLVAGAMLYVYAMASVLLMQGASPLGKGIFAAANVIGLVFDIWKASRNKRLGLAKRACEQFRIELKGWKEFSNRTAAVAFVAKRAADCRNLQSKQLLPFKGRAWEVWWQILAIKLGDDPGKEQLIEEILSTITIDDFTEQLLVDMDYGLDARLIPATGTTE